MMDIVTPFKESPTGASLFRSFSPPLSAGKLPLCCDATPGMCTN